MTMTTTTTTTAAAEAVGTGRIIRVYRCTRSGLDETRSRNRWSRLLFNEDAAAVFRSKTAGNEDRFIVAEKPTSKWFVRVYLFVWIFFTGFPCNTFRPPARHGSIVLGPLRISTNLLTPPLFRTSRSPPHDTVGRRSTPLKMYRRCSGGLLEGDGWFAPPGLFFCFFFLIILCNI